MPSNRVIIHDEFYLTHLFSQTRARLLSLKTRLAFGSTLLMMAIAFSFQLLPSIHNLRILLPAANILSRINEKTLFNPLSSSGVIWRMAGKKVH